MKKSKTLRLVVLSLLLVSIISCSKEDDKINVQQNVASFSISKLPEIPEFARSISVDGEERKFILLTEKDEELLFNLSSKKAQYFGKKRVLYGTVTSGGITENAFMYLGENGFYLSFTKDGKPYEIEKNGRLDFGYDYLMKSNIERISSKKSYIMKILKDGYRSKKLVFDENMINKFLNPVFINETKNASEANYLLVDVGLQDHKSIDTYKCQTELLNDQKSLSSECDFFDTKEGRRPKLDFIYIEKNFKKKAITNVIESIAEFTDGEFFIDITSSGPHFLEESMDILENDPEAVDEFVERISDYTNAFAHDSAADDSSDQKIKLNNFYKKYYSDRLGEYVFGALFGKIWNDGIRGLAGGHSWSGCGGSPRYESASFVASDAGLYTVAHEFAHVVGAGHTERSLNDVMIPSRIKTREHKNAINIEIMKKRMDL